MSIDLSLDREPAELVDAIWEARRGDRRELRRDIARLLQCESAVVREEALTLLFGTWRNESSRDELLSVLQLDPDFGVRSQAVLLLSQLSDERTAKADRLILRRITLDRDEDPVVRKTSYEALHALVKGRPVTLADAIDLDHDVDLSWVEALS